MEIYEKIKKDQIRPVVLNTVFNESQRIPAIAAFIKQFGYFQEPISENEQDDREAIKRLAYAYSETFVIDGKEQFPPMRLRYNAAVGEDTPTNDAYIMAEASYYGYPLVTANKKDFVFSESNFHSNGRVSGFRKVGIININRIFDCKLRQPSGKLDIPAPMSFDLFMDVLHTHGLWSKRITDNSTPHTSDSSSEMIN